MTFSTWADIWTSCFLYCTIYVLCHVDDLLIINVITFGPFQCRVVVEILCLLYIVQYSSLCHHHHRPWFTVTVGWFTSRREVLDQCLTGLGFTANWFRINVDLVQDLVRTGSELMSNFFRI